jgi:hypothetical protein
MSPVGLRLLLLLQLVGTASHPIFSNGRDVRGLTAGERYVGSKVCSSCHAEIYKSFSKTDMGRSMS